MSGAVEGVALPDAVTTLDVFVAAYDSEPDDAIVNADDDLLTWGHLRTILAALTTPPARSYADAIEDAAKVAENLCADMTVEANAETASLTSTLHRASAQTAGKIAAAIRLLSQGEKA